MKLRIAFALLTLYLIWGSTYLAIRFAVETIPPCLMAATRFLAPGLLLVVWRRLVGDPAPSRRQWASAARVGLLLLMGGNGLVSWAEQRIESGIAALLVSTTPVWLVLTHAVASRQRPRWQAILGLLAGFGGVILLVGPGERFVGQGRHDLAGIAALLAAAFLWAVGSIYSRTADLPRSPLLATGMEMLAGSAGLLLASLGLGEWRSFDPGNVTLRSALGVLYLAVFGSLGGFVAYTWLLRNAPVALVSTYAYVNPLVAILLGVWLAQESLAPRVLFAAAVILGSVILIHAGRQEPAHAPSAAAD